MIKVNALGDACPIPVVKTKQAIKELNGPGQVEILVDNEIAVQNLVKMAVQKGYEVHSEKITNEEYRVIMIISGLVEQKNQSGQKNPSGQTETLPETFVSCIPSGNSDLKEDMRNTVVVIASDQMGEGSDELGKILMKGFIFALTQLDTLPAAMLFYNGGAKMTTEGSPALIDLLSLETRGVEILTCGTCLNHYGLTDKLSVGSVTNMYAITEKLMEAGHILKP